jgi:hypothetical protein
LTESAQKQLKADISLFEVTDHLGNSYFNGPSYFFAIADFVDPDNVHLVENVCKELRTLNVKDYGYSVIKMLAEFKNLRTRIQELGVTVEVTSGTTCPTPPSSVTRRGEWSLGKVFDIYWLFAEAGDFYLG